MVQPFLKSILDNTSFFNNSIPTDTIVTPIK